MSEQKLSLLYDNSPDTLRNICLQYIVAKLEDYTKWDYTWDCYVFNDSIILPREICESLLRVYQKNDRVTHNIACLFRNRLQTPLEEVILKNSIVTTDGIRCLLEHKPRKVELVQCDCLSDEWLVLISKNCENLESLKFGPFQYASRLGTINVQPRQCILINAPKLQRLTIHCSGSGLSPVLLDRQLCNLTHLELTNFDAAADRSCSIHALKNLKSLVLHNISWSVEVVEWIVGLRMLIHLDISQANERLGRYFNPNEVLASLIKNLTHLESLDISGTNLAGTGSAVPALTAEVSADCGAKVKCDIPALMSRVNRPLEFLGLYGTHHNACKRHDIPAKVITGDANEEQILTAAEVYLERPIILTRVLNDLYYIFRNTERYTCYVGRTLAVVLDAMDQHMWEKNIQVSGSAILFYIMKGPEKACMGIKLKKRIIITLLNSMECHSEDETLMRNGCLTLCQFKIPKDVLFAYERVVQLLLTGVADVNQDGFVQRIAIYLLNSLACHVDGKQKLLLGNHDAIEKMLNLISDRLERRVCDDVLEVAWSTMWNVTDETPENCMRFLENRGMEYFLECLKHFPDKEELLRNMMGLLGNVAEVVELRPQLMDKLFLTVFYDLLDSSSDGIEVSYNAAGVLAHMASDGPEAWTVDEPSRDAVLERIASAVDRWDRRAERNINYRSFEPILTLLNAYHTPQCQLWAVWALANLTSVYPNKYCSLVKAEGGLKLLYALVRHAAPVSRKIKHLAMIVIHNCVCYDERNVAQRADTPD